MIRALLPAKSPRPLASAPLAFINSLLPTDARDIPQWLIYLREGDGSSESPEPPHPPNGVGQRPQEALVTQLGAQVTALRQCIG